MSHSGTQELLFSLSFALESEIDQTQGPEHGASLIQNVPLLFSIQCY